MKYIIDKKKMPKTILTFIVASSFIFTTTGNIKAKQKKAQIIGQSDYNYYVGQYLTALKEDNYKYDEKFIDIYQNGQYIVGDKTYDIKEIYLVKLLYGDFHLIKAGENKIDIVTGEKFNEPKANICCFRDTSIFYELYSIGMIEDKNIVLDEKIERYASYWNGEKHKEVRDLRADAKAQENYREKYGK